MAFLPLQMLTPQEIFDYLASSDDGLSDREVSERTRLYGQNCLIEPYRTLPVRQWIQYISNPMSLLLWGAGLISMLIGHIGLGLVIWTIVVINSFFSFWSESRAIQALDTLRKMLPVNAVVLRNGQRKPIPASEIVPGDIIILTAGDRIPADARLIESFGFRTNQSALTGEVMPVLKISEPFLRDDLSELEYPNLIFSGTTVVSGNGKAVVYRTGMTTQFGRIAQLTQTQKEEPSHLQRQIQHITKYLSAAGILLAVIIFIIGVYDIGIQKKDALALSIGILAATLPEGLAATITLALAMSVQRLAPQGIFVKKLSIVETLGSVSVICTDKSGTLTQNQMTVREIWTKGDRYSVTGVGYDPYGEVISMKTGTIQEFRSSDLDLIGRTAILCNNSRLLPSDSEQSAWHSLGDQTESALRVMAIKFGLKSAAVENEFPRIYEIPFDAHRKRMSTIHTNNHQLLICTKGAPKEILYLCSHILIEGQTVELSEEMRKEILQITDEFSSSSLRVLALAQREIPYQKGPFYAEMIECGLTFLGLIGMMDPPRVEVARAVQTIKQAGIRMMMITGDYGLTAESIARRIGMLSTKNTRLVTGSEIDGMDDEALAQLLSQEIVFSRMAPEHKLRIVNLLKDQGEVVAFIGDGVNDTPAIRAADVGIAMGLTGSDAAKESADVILMRDDFSSIVTAIGEGRSIFENIRKSITYIFASNIPEILPFFLTAIFQIPLALTVAQVIAIDFVTDLFPALGLCSEKPELNVMLCPPRRKDQLLVDRSLLLQSFLRLGGTEFLLCFLLFVSVYWDSGNLLFDSLNRKFVFMQSNGQVYLTAITVYYAGVVFVQFGNAFVCRTEKNDVRIIGIFSNPHLIFALFLSSLFLMVTIYFTPVKILFQHVSLPFVYWLRISLLIPIFYLIEKIRKQVFELWKSR